MAVSRRLRFEILRRDNHACRYCGATAPDVKLTVDHVVPVALGGSDDASNLVTACAACNGGKSSLSPDAPVVADVTEDQLRWARAMDEAATAQRAKRAALLDFIQEFDDEWRDITGGHTYGIIEGGYTRSSDPDTVLPWGVYRDEKLWQAFATEDEADACIDRELQRTVFSRPSDWEDTVEAWFVAGVRLSELTHFMEVVTRKKYLEWDRRWRYFCGCVWGLLRQRQEIASAILAKEEAE